MNKFYLAIALTIAPSLLFATTIHVPDDQPTIHAGISAATSGDTVLVACGTYCEFDLQMKSGVDLIGEATGADCVVIDAQDNGRVLLAQNLELVVHVENMTLKNGFQIMDSFGSDLGGGGVLCLRSEMVFKHVRFECNTCDRHGPSLGHGGGVYALESTLHYCNTAFVNNHARSGGGLYCPESSNTIIDSDFIGNSAAFGGAINSISSDLSLQSTVFESNHGSCDPGGRGGAVDISGGTATLENVLFSNNTYGGGPMESYGGALCSSGDMVMKDCSFIANQVSRGYGGACAFRGGSIDFQGGLLYQNHSYEGDGPSAIYVSMSCGSAQFERLTIVENFGLLGYNSSAVSCEGAAHFANTIIANNLIAVGIVGASVTLSSCDIWGNEFGNFGGGLVDPTGTDGNISLDPEFCGGLGSGYYYLQSDSPCAPGGAGANLIGYLPVACGTVSSRATSWSQVKALY